MEIRNKRILSVVYTAISRVLPLMACSLLFLSGCVEHRPQQEDRLAEIQGLDIPDRWKNTSVLLLEYTTDLVFEVADDGNRLKMLETKWYKIYNIAYEGIRYVSIPEDQVVEHDVKIRAAAYYPDGSTWHLDKASIKTQQKKFSDSVDHTFYIPQYQRGLLLKLEVEREYHSPEYAGRYLFRDTFPVLKRVVTLSYPEDVDLQYGIENAKGTNIEESFAVENGVKKEKVTAAFLTNFREKDKTQFPEEYYEGLYVSFPPQGKKSYTWQQLGDHYLQQSADAFAISPSIKELAKNIQTHGSGNSVIEQGFNTVVRKIRYHGDWRGRHAFIPRNASIVLENGYGDCKELSTILKSLLKEKQIETYPVLVSVWGSFQPLEKYPFLGSFNHMILASGKGEKGNLDYFDATRSWAHAKNSYLGLVGRKALILKPGGSQLVTISSGHHFENQVVTNSSVKKDINGEWVIDGTIELMGYPAVNFYEMYQESSQNNRKVLTGGLLEKGFGIAAKSVDIVEADANHVHIAYQAGFEEHHLSIGRGGVNLTIPTLYKQEVNRGLTEKLGTTYLRKFNQEDAWTLPFPANKTALPSFSSVVAESKWHVSGNTISRSYAQSETRRKSRDWLLHEWAGDLETLTNGVVWR